MMVPIFRHTFIRVNQGKHNMCENKRNGLQNKILDFRDSPPKQSVIDTNALHSYLNTPPLRSSLLCLLHSISFVIKELYLLRKMPHNYMTRFQKSCTSYCALNHENRVSYFASHFFCFHSRVSDLQNR
jgi:hypothetical protein